MGMKFLEFVVTIATCGTVRYVSQGSNQRIFHQTTKGENGFIAGLD